MALIKIILSIRVDGFSYISRFIVRMSISIYDIFTEFVVQKIGFQLKSVVRENTNIVIILNLIKSKSISDVYFYRYEIIDDQYFKYTLNVFFAHIDSQYFFIKIETLYSQHRKELMKLIDKYIFDFNDNIVVIFGFDIEYDIKFRITSFFIW